MRARHPGLSSFAPWSLRVRRDRFFLLPGLDKSAGFRVEYYSLTEGAVIGLLLASLKGGERLNEKPDQPSVIIKETQREKE
jgi:hypothetical protein